MLRTDHFINGKNGIKEVPGIIEDILENRGKDEAPNGYQICSRTN
jgi:hypothetical protein